MNRRELFKLFGALPVSPLLLVDKEKKSKRSPVPLGTRKVDDAGRHWIWCQIRGPVNVRVGDVVEESNRIIGVAVV